MSNGLISEIVNFTKTLPAWQKILAKLAFDTKRFINGHEPEIELALKRFKYDNGLSDELVGQEIIAEIEALDVPSPQELKLTPRILKISNCKHINALTSNQEIIFSPKLTVIFGENGSGKSGYARLLNSVFYSRGDCKILPNILKPITEQGDAEAEFLFQVDGQQVSLKYPPDKNKAEFKHFACFDSKTVNIQLQNSNELFVTPLEMEFFSKLVQLIKIVSEKIKADVSTRKDQNNFYTLLQGESTIKEFIKLFNDKTNLDDLYKLIGDSRLTAHQLDEAEKEYLELRQSSPESKLKEISDIRRQLEELKNEFECLFKNYYNATYLDKIKISIEVFIKTKEKSQQTGINSFKTDLLKSTGTESWKRFIVSMASLADEEIRFYKENSLNLMIIAHYACSSYNLMLLSCLRNILTS